MREENVLTEGTVSMRSLPPSLAFAITAAAIGTALTIAGCSDARDGASVTGTRGVTNGAVATAPDLDAQINTLINELFKTGHATAVAARWRNVKNELTKGDAAAREKYLELLDWIQGKTADITPAAGETQAHAIARLVLLMSAYVYEGPAAVVPAVTPTTEATFTLVLPGEGALIRQSWEVAAFIPQGAVSEPTIVVITKSDGEFAECSGPLPTFFCQYPEFRRFSVFPDARLNTAATIALCRTGTRTPPERTRLRIAHQRPSDPAAFHPDGFIADAIEILPTADTHMLTACAPADRVGGSVFMFSDFGIVDPVGLAPPVALVFTSAPTRTIAGEPVPVVVEVRDASDRPVGWAGDLVSLSAVNCLATDVVCVAQPEGAPSSLYSEAVSPRGGRAYFVFVVITHADPAYRYWLIARTDGGLIGRREFTSLPGPASVLRVLEGDGQTAAIGTAVPVAPSVQLADAYANRVRIAGVPVRFELSGGGSVANPVTVTNSDGIATAGAWTLGPFAGLNTLGAISDAVTGTAAFSATGTAQVLNASVISAGWDFTCAVSSGLPYCWGDNAFGQLGDGTLTARNRPTLVASGLAALTRITGGFRFACGLTAGGAASCWGDNLWGQLGIDAQDLNRHTLPETVAGGHTFAQISAGFAHVCALDTDGVAWCWGGNSNGELGVGVDRTGFTHPLRVAAMTPGIQLPIRFTQIDVGGNTSCGLATSGEIWCWGSNTNGVLGSNSDEAQSFIPVRVAGDRTWTQVSVGTAHACGVSGGSVYCWGSNSFGQLGMGNTATGWSLVPVPALGVLGTTRQVTAGNAHTCAFTTTGPAYCWGDNRNGQLGDLTQTSSASAVLVGASAHFMAMTAGVLHTCALREGGDAYCWGSNASGRLGIGSSTALRTAPAPVALPGFLPPPPPPPPPPPSAP